VTEWVAKQISAFGQFAERRVASFEGIEMAIIEDEGAGVPRFHDERVPCLQFAVLYVRFDDGMIAEVGTYQDDDEFRLSVEWLEAPPRASAWEGIFRFRAVPELPAGLVHSVTTSTNDRGNLSYVSLFIAQREIRLVAGEIEESRDGSLLFRRDDESVLVFANAADVTAVPWTADGHGRRAPDGGPDVGCIR
jgi:hypothetical protein